VEVKTVLKNQKKLQLVQDRKSKAQPDIFEFHYFARCRQKKSSWNKNYFLKNVIGLD
jgi:hypothetical protein